MKLLRQIRCAVRKKTCDCFDKEIKQVSAKICDKNYSISKVKEETTQMNNVLLNITTLTDLMRVRTNIDITDNYKLFVSNEPCSLDPSNCKEYYRSIKKENVKLRNIYSNTCKDLKGLADIQSDIKRLYRFKTEENFNNYFFQLGRDKKDKLICITFDMNSFDINYTPTLFLSYGRVKETHSRMYLKYLNSGKLEIVDFFSVKKRIGHGSLMLQSLISLVPLLNRKIDSLNNELFIELNRNKNLPREQFERSYSYGHSITEIYGTIYPEGEITREVLTHFYNLNGFIENGRLVRKI
ncbi:hypothetical protein [Paenibacillus polymyxa]|uniref:hypothetical protein n=1 Tax=Paenibacillus TaxID=44249 RepID=UPI0025B6CEC7|nr:hypothetical protein [Paenibacillus polymyxa]MDN4084089.1 hypothetical protein [Paenibacillus polymyxa]MDN4087058.1 hypothetical protein [Paenibacillus polymyxa]MDN4108679.1 hypothetical protein [Paenibacillus polymyxa]